MEAYPLEKYRGVIAIVRVGVCREYMIYVQNKLDVNFYDTFAPRVHKKGYPNFLHPRYLFMF